MFSAALPLGERKLGEDVPITFKQLDVGTTEEGEPRDPGCVAARTSRQIGSSLDVTAPIMLCVSRLTPFPAVLKRVPPRSLEPGVDFSYEVAGDRGAALTTRHSTYNEDSQLDSEFKEYTKRHYKSWVKFASDKKYGKDLRPVLVSGVDMAKDFAMMAYSNNRSSVQSDETFSTPMFGSTSTTSASWTWRTACSPHFKHGPQQRRPPSSLQPGTAESAAKEFNQCVFLRYYTVRFGFGLFPRVIRAGAGPHDLGSGDNRGNTFPELTVPLDADPMTIDEDPGEQEGPAANDSGSQLDMVTRNVPYVRFFARSSVSALTVASRMKGMTVGTQSQIMCSM